MTANNAFISIDNICFSWLVKKGKTIHSYYKILPLAVEAITELSLTSLPMINHKLITKQDYETWFKLPGDYVEWASAGIRVGEHWRPVPVSSRLIPFPNTVGSGQMDSQFGDGIDCEGVWTSWLNPAVVTTNGSSNTPQADYFSPTFFDPVDYGSDGLGSGSGGLFSPYYFSGSIFSVAGSGPNQKVTHMPVLVTSDGRQDVMVINAAKNIAVVPSGFPSNELYLVYVAIGGVDSMTHIPVIAQKAIESYIDWQYALNKRGRLGEATTFKALFDEQHRILRARLNDMDVVDVLRILEQNYGNTMFG